MKHQRKVMNKKAAAVGSLFLGKKSLYLIVFICLVLLGWGWEKLKDPELFPINTIKIESAYQHVPQEEIEKVLTPLVEKSFFAVRMAEIQERLQQFPWILSVSTKRVWPNKLLIRIKEQQAIARWEDDALMNDQGMVFMPEVKSIPTDLPQLKGPKHEANLVLKKYQEMGDVVSSLGFKISQLEYTDNHSWIINLDNGIKIYLGKEDTIEKLQRFVNAYQKIIGDRGSEVRYVDLRYNNGMAIRWSGKATNS